MEEDRIIYVVTNDKIDNLDGFEVDDYDEYVIGHFYNREDAIKAADGAEVHNGEIISVWEVNDETGERLNVVYDRTK